MESRSDPVFPAINRRGGGASSAFFLTERKKEPTGADSFEYCVFTSNLHQQLLADLAEVSFQQTLECSAVSCFVTEVHENMEKSGISNPSTRP